MAAHWDDAMDYGMVAKSAALKAAHSVAHWDDVMDDAMVVRLVDLLVAMWGRTLVLQWSRSDNDKAAILP